MSSGLIEDALIIDFVDSGSNRDSHYVDSRIAFATINAKPSALQFEPIWKDIEHHVPRHVL
jgi:hypothetical protein